MTAPTIYRGKEDDIRCVEYRGTKFKTGMVLCKGLMDDGLPDVYIIDQLIEGPGAICFPLDVTYIPHIRSYQITHTHFTASRCPIDIQTLHNISPIDILFYGNIGVLSQRCPFR